MTADAVGIPIPAFPPVAGDVENAIFGKMLGELGGTKDDGAFVVDDFGITCDGTEDDTMGAFEHIGGDGKAAIIFDVFSEDRFGVFTDGLNDNTRLFITLLEAHKIELEVSTVFSPLAFRFLIGHLTHPFRHIERFDPQP